MSEQERYKELCVKLFEVQREIERLSLIARDIRLEIEKIKAQPAT